MEEKKPALLVKGLFDFDRKGVLYLLGLICGIGAIVLGVLSMLKVKFDYSDYIVIGLGGLAFLFGLIGWIGTLVGKKKAILIYEDHITFAAGGASFTEQFVDVVKFSVRDGVLTLTGKQSHIVPGIINPESVNYVLDILLNTRLPEDLSGPDLVYVNIAIEELRKARELFRVGLISEADLREKKRRYMEAASKYYLVNGNAGASKF